MNTMTPGQQIMAPRHNGVAIQGFRVDKMDTSGQVVMNQPIQHQPPHQPPPPPHIQQQQQQQRFVPQKPLQHQVQPTPQPQPPPPPPPQPHHTKPQMKQLILPNSCPEEEVDFGGDKYPLYADSFVAASSLCLVGCIFYFDDAFLKRCPPYCKGGPEVLDRKISEWKNSVIRWGALVEETYNSVTCTHVISSGLHSEVVQRALADGVRVATPLWLDWVIFRRVMAHPTHLLHLPLPISAQASAQSKIRVSASHFRPRTNVLVTHALALFPNIQVTKMLYRDTDVLLVPRPAGDKYFTATRFDTPALNLNWLRDMLLGKEDASSWSKPEYQVKNDQATRALCLREDCAFTKRMLKAWEKPIRIEVDFEHRAKLRKIEEAKQPPGANGEPSPKKQKMLAYKAQPRVMFSGLTKDEEAELVKKLTMCGGKHVEHVEDATHLVAKSFKRSLKWYVALNTCGWVVTPEWINESFNSKWFLDEDHFQLKDNESENKYGFSVRESLKRANSQRIFAGLQFAILSNSIRPSKESLAVIIRSGGGTLLGKMPPIKTLKQVKKIRDEDPLQCRPVIVLSSTEKSEHEHIRILREADINCYSPELVLSASLKQVIELGPHLIRETGKSY